MLQLCTDEFCIRSYKPDPGYQRESDKLTAIHNKQEVSPFPAGDHKAQINKHAQRHNKHKTEKHKRSTKEVQERSG